jgi:hypothetical protein
VACDTDNYKLHNEKTPQLTKGQRYDRLKRKSTFQTSWKKKIHGVEASGRADNHGDLISLKLAYIILFKITILGWKLDFVKPAFYFIWAIKQSMFVYWLYSLKLDFRRHFLLCVFGSLISMRLPAIMLMRFMK